MKRKMGSDNLAFKYIYITFVVALYWIVSIITVFVNKELLSSNRVNLNAPLFITWFQCIISAGICITLSQLSKIFPRTIKFPDGNPFDRHAFVKVLPLSLLFTAMIALNNLCLKHVDISFYYVGRSLTTIFNVVFSYLVLHQTTSKGCVLCCLLIIGGFMLGVDQENVAGSLSIMGTIFGILGSLSLSLYSIYTKKILPYVNHEIWLLSYYNNVYSCFLFLPLIIFTGEIGEIIDYPNLSDSYFWIALFIGGICGFSIGFVTALQIKVTSPLTHNISGTAKACAQTVMASYWFQETRSPLWWFSNFVVLFGSAAYARFKQLEMEAKHQLLLHK